MCFSAAGPDDPRRMNERIAPHLRTTLASIDPRKDPADLSDDELAAVRANDEWGIGQVLCNVTSLGERSCPASNGHLQVMGTEVSSLSSRRLMYTHLPVLAASPAVERLLTARLWTPFFSHGPMLTLGFLGC